jgi:hypothetical protein
MDRRSRRRISRTEELVSVALKKRERGERVGRYHARRHATAVAAIVLSGQPRVDEPLIRAWARALQHYGIDVNKPAEWADQVAAAQRLLPIILGGEEESARFTEIFSMAPVWLLQFTGMAMDARLLKFHLPDISEKLTWGSHGFEDARRWPLLPLDMMTAGDPIPDLDERRLWIVLFCMMPNPIPDFGDDLPQEDEENSQEDEINSYRRNDPLLDDIFFALDLDEKPEKEWSRYEKRRMRKLAERISRL